LNDLLLGPARELCMCGVQPAEQNKCKMCSRTTLIKTAVDWALDVHTHTSHPHTERSSCSHVHLLNGIAMHDVSSPEGRVTAPGVTAPGAGGRPSDRRSKVAFSTTNGRVLRRRSFRDSTRCFTSTRTIESCCVSRALHVCVCNFIGAAFVLAAKGAPFYLI
jgi:hypothetical protein